jgi:hypothetical protein
MILLTESKTRVNDRWMHDSSIACQRPDQAVIHPLIESGPNDLQSRYQAAFYDHVAFDIATESVFHYPYAYVSEKTLRALACKRLFVVVGAAGTVKLLEEHGFDTFTDWVDHSYDNISCPVTRFRTVQQEILRLIDISINDFREFYVNNAARFEHNFRHLQGLRSRECQALESRLRQIDRK